MSKNGKTRRVSRITMQLLSLLEKDNTLSQRKLSDELGIALGATNAYIQKCVTQGWVMKSAPHSFTKGYRLTACGLAKKSKLVARCLRNDLNGYTGAKQCLESLMEEHPAFYIFGTGSLAEIAYLCALKTDERAQKILGFYEPENKSHMQFGKPIFHHPSELDAHSPILFTAINNPLAHYKNLIENINESRVVVPEILHETTLTQCLNKRNKKENAPHRKAS